jgi:hypothetical protein
MAITLQTLRQQPIYQTSAATDALLTYLADLSQIDAEVERRLKIVNILLGVGIAVSFISVPLLSVPGVGLFSLPVGLGLVTVGVLGRWGLVPHNIPNYRYGLLARVLQMLQRDMAPDQPVTLKMVLTPVDQRQKKIDTIPHPRRQGWKIDRYTDPWLELSGQFLDGTCFTLSATELFQSHHGWKRGRSGKSKRKRKPKPKGQVLTLKLAFSQRKYGAVTELENLQRAVRLPLTARLKRFVHRNNKLALEVKSSPNPPVSELYETISLMFLSVYQILNLSRELSKQP